MMLVNPDRRVFVGRRLDQRLDAWQMPQGGIDPGEAPAATALRELQEEIGTAKAEIVRESRGWLTYDLPPDLVPKVWHGRYRGQRQKWFVMRFLGQDRDIDIATEHPEFDSWRWVGVDELPDIIVPFKQVLYRQVVDEFRSYFDAA
jgi:putative (di)nucleoside polyphosphate hydrolase